MSPESVENFDSRRLIWLRWTLTVGICVQMALCPRLWTEARAFPTIPAFNALPELPQLPTLLLLGLFLLSMLAAAIRPTIRWVSAMVPVTGAMLVLFDISRLQPWFYLALILFAIVSLLPGSDAGSVAGFVVVATYFWSGIQKMNGPFGNIVFPWLLQPFRLAGLHPLWPVAPLAEMAVAVLLFLPRTRSIGLVVAAGMHLLLLVALGPFGRNFNTVVWPWNLWMPLVGTILLFRQPAPLLPSASRTWAGKTILVLVGLLPALNLAGRWDNNLSAGLYSGKTAQAFILFTNQGASRLPSEIQPYLQRRPDRIGLDIARWSIADLNVPPYPEIRVYQALCRRLAARGVPENSLSLVLLDPKTRRVPIR